MSRARAFARGGQPPRLACHVARATPAFRPGNGETDAAAIRALVWAERMNPLGLDPARFLVADADAGSENALLAIGQLKIIGENDYEIASLVTAPAARGAGVGASLLDALIAAAPPGSRLWLTTIQTRIQFYRRAGFETVPVWRVKGEEAQRPPWPLLAEAAVGSIVARVLLGVGLVVMRRDV